MSADGRFVAFDSCATNLVAGDTNGEEDVFVHDRVTGTTERVSLSSIGTEAVGGPSRDGRLSADGRYVAFVSFAPNLVPGDTNHTGDVFVRDRVGATTELVSVGSDGSQGNGAEEPSISADGRFVAWFPRPGTQSFPRSAGTAASWPSTRTRPPWSPARPTRAKTSTGTRSIAGRTCSSETG